jgi:hypothetical protein
MTRASERRVCAAVDLIAERRDLRGFAEAHGVNGRPGLSILTRRRGAAEKGAEFLRSLRFR